MSNQDIDRLLEHDLSGEPAPDAFRVRVLMDSTEAFLRARQTRGRWHFATLSAAAVLLVGVSFLVGRWSTPRPSAGPVIAVADDTVAVPKELVACLSAARLFKQLHMEDRMNRALDCAGRLLPREAIATGSTAESVFAAGGEGIENPRRYVGSSAEMGSSRSMENADRILAGHFGGYRHESGVD
ncbi:MAG: hypothetical protein KBE65_19825 [Phycisphaerae bacterium]|nr:hypothetical protein [Phycisphaerae bacterium]